MGRRPLPERVGISQPYGSNPGGFNPPGGHTGTDYAAPLGTDVIAVADARVLHADWGYNLPGGRYDYHLRWMYDKDFPGILVIMEHDDCLTSPAHLLRTDLNAGDQVVQGQIVGQSGSTGSASTGPHTHFEVIPKPLNYATSTYGRTNPAPYTREPYKVSAGQPSRGGWDNTAPATGPEWFPGAVRRPQGGAVTLDRSLPPRGVWHITADVAPGKQQPTQDAVGGYLESMAYCPHLLWDPFTGRVIQYYPATVGARALKAWNEDGRVAVQIEVLFSPGAVRDGKRYERLADTPLQGFTALVQWLDALGIPRAWPMGPPPPIGTSGSRSIEVWNSRGGHYGHSQVPGNDHTDPGVFPDILKVPRNTGAATAPGGTDLLEELVMATPQQIDKLFNDYYTRNRGKANTLAWAVANDRDRGVNLERRMVGLPQSILDTKINRQGSGKGTTVTLGTVAAYDKDNEDRARRFEQATTQGLQQLAGTVASMADTIKQLQQAVATLTAAAHTTSTTEQTGA